MLPSISSIKMNYSEQKVISRDQNTGNLVDIVLFSLLWYKGSAVCEANLTQISNSKLNFRIVSSNRFLLCDTNFCFLCDIILFLLLTLCMKNIVYETPQMHNLSKNTN